MTAPTEEAQRPAPGRHFAPTVESGPSRRFMAVFGGVLVVVLVAASALTWLGVNTVRESRAGRSVDTVNDPALPGFEALLEPTPTLLVLHVRDDALVSTALMALSSGDQGGSVMVIPPQTQTGTAAQDVALSYVMAFVTDPAQIRPAAQDLLGTGIGEVVVVDDARWAELLAPVAPLVITNPDPVGDFPAGELSLTPDQVGAYLTVIGEGESELGRMYRQQLVYEAWITAVAASTEPAVVPGEVDGGIGRFVRGLAAGAHRVTTLPVIELPPNDFGFVRVDPDAAAVAELLPQVVPFPTSPRPGARVRVRVLDGTGDPEHVLQTAPLLIPADAEVVVVGNADRFDYDETEIRYHVTTRRRAAEALREALGAGRVVDDPRQTDAFDVTIVLGTDV